MNKSLYQKLAINNIKKNRNTFLPFTISNTTMIAMFFMLLSIRDQASMATFFGGNTMHTMLNLGVWICGLFSIGVIYYTNGFLMKRRKKELGLYSILGLEKKHIGKVLFWEIALVSAVSIIGGIFVGMLFSKLMYLVLLNLLQVSSNLVFSLSIKTVGTVVVIFGAIFAVTILYNNVRLMFLKPIELLRGSDEGEKEPKAKWIIAIMGFVCLGIGYYLALTTQNAIAAINIFFIAVLFVIAGTYFLFMSGSIVFLKLLKKNKNYYYHKTHFITVSGLMYRMKQNAIGLANICILSTAVLVVLSSTVSLYLGLDNVMRTFYPSDIMTDYVYEPEQDAIEGNNYIYDNQLITEVFQKQAELNHVTVTDAKGYYNLSIVGNIENNNFTEIDSELSSFEDIEVMTLEDFVNEGYIKADQITLQDNEALLYSRDKTVKNMENVNFLDSTYTFVEGPVSKEADNLSRDTYTTAIMVVKDLDNLKDIRDQVNAIEIANGGEAKESITYNYECNLTGELTDKMNYSNGLRDAINNAGIPHVATVSDIFTTRQEIVGLYGSLLFIGIFIGTMFLMTTVLIIYYKQISEGYDDRRRFTIMQNVGMSKQEVKTVIKNQVLTIFFLPILLAIVHIVFAFDIIRKMLALLNLTNVTLFVECTIGTIAVFFIIYAIVYILTARTYYKIVEMD